MVHYTHLPKDRLVPTVSLLQRCLNTKGVGCGGVTDGARTSYPGQSLRSLSQVDYPTSQAYSKAAYSIGSIKRPRATEAR
jgi:hypothetical protein